MQEFLRTVFELNNNGAFSTYWFLLIWLFGMGLVLHKAPKRVIMVNGRPKECWFWFFAILFTAPLVLWATYRNGFGDTLSYALIFQRSPDTFAGLKEYIQSRSVDTGFYFLITVIKLLGVENFTTFFLLLAALQVWCMVYTMRKYSANFWISIFLFVASTDYMSWMYNGVRQFLAVCVTFAAFDLMVRRKYVQTVCVILLASTIHGTALLMLPFMLLMQGDALNRKTMIAIVFTVLCVPFVDELMPFMESTLDGTQYGDIMSNNVWANDDGTNGLRVLVYSVPALIALFGRRYLIRSNNREMNLCVNATVITMIVYLASAVTSGIYIGRIPIYTTLYGYMALPWIIDQIFEKYTVRLVNIMMIACYTAFFVFQMHQWGLV